MGSLNYAGIRVVEFEDRTLAHAQMVIVAKFRRGEAFCLSWDEPASGERNVLWLHPSLPLQFVFVDPARIAINHQWVDDLMTTANSPNGLHLGAESVARD